MLQGLKAQLHSESSYAKKKKKKENLNSIKVLALTASLQEIEMRKHI